MTTADVKSQIAQKLDLLSPSLLAAVNEFLGSLLAESRQVLSTEETETNKRKNFDDDPLIGLINGSPGLARNSEDILQQEIVSGSGWTCK